MMNYSCTLIIMEDNFLSITTQNIYYVLQNKLIVFKWRSHIFKINLYCDELKSQKKGDELRSVKFYGNTLLTKRC